ncbi:MAG: PadR family transcriptional regulator [Bacillota bacterium]|nr:PadR family transcriptional regulator [Bacillota bacterium]
MERIQTRGRHLPAFVLLAVLRCGRMHGRGIDLWLSAHLPGGWQADQPSVYRTLRDLESAGAVESEWRTGRGAAAREYTITPRGRELLREWSEEIRRSRDNLDFWLEAWKEAEDVRG